jgi:DnaK suppressor protein
MTTRAHRKMSSRQMDRMRKQLLQRRSRLVQGLRSQYQSLRNTHLVGNADTGDAASGAIQEFESLNVAQLQARELRQIDGAIERIDAGTFNVCEECEGPIGRARLEALPHATLCVSCQQKLELHGDADSDDAAWEGVEDLSVNADTGADVRLDGVAGR